MKYLAALVLLFSASCYRSYTPGDGVYLEERDGAYAIPIDAFGSLLVVPLTEEQQALSVCPPGIQGGTYTECDCELGTNRQGEERWWFSIMWSKGYY